MQGDDIFAEPLPDLDGDNNEPEPEPESAQAPKPKRKGKVDDTDKYMGDIAKGLNRVVDYVSKPKASTQDDVHDSWAKILACKLRQMDPMKAEHFKVRVDSMALELIEANLAHKAQQND